MRFTLPVLAVLSTSVLATPKPVLTSRDVLTTTEAADAIQFAVQAADCDVGDCVSVVASAVCIAGGILARSVPIVTGCVQGGAPSLCGCANCVGGLGDFLEEHGLCPN